MVATWIVTISFSETGPGDLDAVLGAVTHLDPRIPEVRPGAVEVAVRAPSGDVARDYVRQRLHREPLLADSGLVIDLNGARPGAPPVPGA